MDRKQLITSITVVIAVLGLWWGFVHVLEKLEPQLFVMPAVPEQPSPATQPGATQPAVASTTHPAAAGTTQPGIAAAPGTLPATAPAVATTPPAPASPPAIAADGAAEPAPSVLLGTNSTLVSANSPYAIGVLLTPTGAAIDSVTLNRYGLDDAHRKSPYNFQHPYPGHPDSASLASRSIIVNGTTIDLSQVNWKVLPGNDSTHAAFELPLVASDGKPVAMLKRTFSLDPASTDPKTSQGYELSVDWTVQNLSAAPLTVQAAFNGTTMPPQEIDRSDDRSVINATSISPGALKVAQHYVAEFKPEAAEMDLSKDAVWVGEASSYFNAVVLPRSTAATAATAVEPKYTIKATALEPQNLKAEAPHDTDPYVVLTFTSAVQTIAPGRTLSMPASVFVGPKQRDLLDSPYYTAFPRCYDQSLIVHGSCGFLTFGWLVWVLVEIVRFFFHTIALHDWGISIILLVCLVRLLLHPITKRAQVNMMRMGKMGPEIERLKKKYGDDKDALNKAMMGVYKDQGLAPILGCLPMVLQMPIWVALWGALQSTFELRQAPFLWGFTWIKDLAKPDSVLTWTPVHIPLIGTMLGPVGALNILPILMGAVFYLQQKYTPKPPAASPEQEKQQKMMQWMSLLFPLFLYNGPSGLNLYILTSTTIGIFENRIIREHIKQREEAEKAGRVFVETKPTRASKESQKDKNKPKDDGKKSKLGRWMSDLQQRAEQLQKDTDRKKRRET